MRRSISRVQVLLFAILPVAPVMAQTPPLRWELGLAVGPGPQFSGTLRHRFSPELPGHPEATGAGGQDVRLRADVGNAAALSVTRMLGRRLGVQAVFVAARAPLGGSSSDYGWELSYLARQPPDYQPQALDITSSAPWPATDGEVRELALAANLVLRYPIGRRATLTMSGGVAVQRVDGELRPLGVTLFSEGGHATLLPETYRVRVALGPARAVGVDLGSELAWRLGERLTAVLEVRYFAARSLRLDARVDRVLAGAVTVHQATPMELNEGAPLHRVSLDPSFGAALVGLRCRF